MLTATKDLTAIHAQSAQPVLTLVEPTKPPAQPLPPESLSAFGIAYSIVSSPATECPMVLDRVLGDEYETHFGTMKPMTLRQIRDEMGTSFQFV